MARDSRHFTHCDEDVVFGLFKLPAASETLAGTRWERGFRTKGDERVASETAVALVYNGSPHAVMMATPFDLEAFALGFSLSEGIIEDARQLLRFSQHMVADGIEARIEITAARFRQLERRQRNLAGRTGCGLCGARKLSEAVRPLRAVRDSFRITSEALQRAVADVDSRQPLNAATGAVHAAAWIDGRGNIVHVREDVGRHNALDKLIGTLVGQGVDRGTGAALITSRASYEMVQKAAAVGMQMVCAMSAPTSMAVRVARDCGVTLVAYARAGRHTIYTHESRIVDTPVSAAA